MKLRMKVESWEFELVFIRCKLRRRLGIRILRLDRYGEVRIEKKFCELENKRLRSWR